MINIKKTLKCCRYLLLSPVKQTIKNPSKLKKTESLNSPKLSSAVFLRSAPEGAARSPVQREEAYLDSLGWAGTFGLVLAHKRRRHSPASSAGLASVWPRTPRTNTPLAAHTAAAGSSPGPRHTSTLEQDTPTQPS